MTTVRPINGFDHINKLYLASFILYSWEMFLCYLFVVHFGLIWDVLIWAGPESWSCNPRQGTESGVTLRYWCKRKKIYFLNHVTHGLLLFLWQTEMSCQCVSRFFFPAWSLNIYKLVCVVNMVGSNIPKYLKWNSTKLSGKPRKSPSESLSREITLISPERSEGRIVPLKLRLWAPMIRLSCSPVFLFLFC